MQTLDSQIALVDAYGRTIAGTDLSPDRLISRANITDQILSVAFDDGEERTYFVG